MKKAFYTIIMCVILFAFMSIGVSAEKFDMSDFIVVKEWNFENESDCKLWTAMMNSTIPEYDSIRKALVGVSTTHDSAIKTINVEDNYFSVNNAKYLIITMDTNGKAVSGNMFFQHESSDGWRNSNGYSFRADAISGFQDVIVELSSNRNWEGEIQGLRFDPNEEANAEYVIKRLAFLATKDVMVNVVSKHGDVSGAGKYERNSQVTVVASDCNGYNFVGWRNSEPTKAYYDFENSNQKWLVSCGKSSITDDSLILEPIPIDFTSTGYDVSVKREKMGFDANSCSYIEIRFKATSNCDTNLNDISKIYFSTIEERALNEGKSFKFNVNDYTPDEEGFYTIRVSTSDSEKWTGTIDTIRFDPTNYNKNIEIDYIWFVGVGPKREYLSTSPTYIFVAEKDVTLIADYERVFNADINSDGKVSIRDASAILRHLAGYETGYDILKMDINGDEEISIRDASLILRYLAGYDVELD